MLLLIVTLFTPQLEGSIEIIVAQMVTKRQNADDASGIDNNNKGVVEIIVGDYHKHSVSDKPKSPKILIHVLYLHGQYYV